MFAPVLLSRLRQETICSLPGAINPRGKRMYNSSSAIFPLAVRIGEWLKRSIRVMTCRESFVTCCHPGDKATFLPGNGSHPNPPFPGSCGATANMGFAWLHRPGPGTANWLSSSLRLLPYQAIPDRVSPLWSRYQPHGSSQPSRLATFLNWSQHATNMARSF